MLVEYIFTVLGGGGDFQLVSCCCIPNALDGTENDWKHFGDENDECDGEEEKKKILVRSKVKE
jgi:hypothetical protein